MKNRREHCAKVSKEKKHKHQLCADAGKKSKGDLLVIWHQILNIQNCCPQQSGRLGMKGPVPEAWHNSTISPQENVNYVTDNVGTAGSQVSCEVHGTTHREFLESFFF